MSRKLLTGIIVAIFVVIIAAAVFSMVAQRPDAGSGPTRDENSAASTPEPGAEPTAN